jgi:hypothetical protein
MQNNKPACKGSESFISQLHKVKRHANICSLKLSAPSYILAAKNPSHHPVDI